MNILLFGLITILLTCSVRLLFAERSSACTIAVIAGTLFACHPIHADAVGSVVGGAELLAATFSLSAFLLYGNEP